MGKLKAFISIVCVTLLCAGGCRLLTYALDDDTDSISRVMMHEFYNQKDIDILFLGASHCMYSVDVNRISEETGKKVFNTSSAGQRPEVTLALLKEALDLYEPEEVYLELSHTVATKEWKSFTSVYLISDYMRNNRNRLELLTGISSSEHYINAIWPARRYTDNIFDLETIAGTLKKKSSSVYKNYEYDYLKNYQGNGYFVNNHTIEEYGYYAEEGFEPFQSDKVPEEWRNAVLEIIDLCQENNIPITLFETKVSDFELTGEGNYDDYINFVNDLVQDRGLKLVDFNVVSDAYLPYSESLYFDADHLNKDGSDQFTDFLIRYMKEEIPETAFYDSVKARFADQGARYYGLSYQDDTDENGAAIRKIRVAANKPEELDFRIEVRPEDSDAYTVLDWGDPAEEFSIPKKTKGTIQVSWREKADSDTEKTVTIDLETK